MRQHGARLAVLVAVFAVASINAGCLLKETSATLCLEPDGSVRWTVLEGNIHATGDTPADRQREEDAFMTAAAINQHPVAVAFRSLGGSDVSAAIASPQWPFAVRTEARFPDVARACQQMLDAVGVRGRSVLERHGARATWTITIDGPDAAAPASRDDASADYAPLFGDEEPTIFLRHGQFVEAAGFTIEDDGRVARMKSLEDHDWEKEPRVVLSLTWVATEAVNAPQR